MKTPFIGLLLVLSMAAVAQNNYRGMSEADMQRMMEQGQKMEACMSKIDQAELDRLEQQSLKMEDEIRALCQGGNRDKAQQTAIAFGKEVNSAPVMQQVRECTALMDGMMQMMPPIPFSGEEKEDASGHVCDGF